MDEDLELKMLRLKKMRKLMAESAKPGEKKQLSEEEAMKLLRSRLVGRGNEVLDAALEQHPELAKRVVIVLAEKIRSGKLTRDISGANLLALFEFLGARIKLGTTIRYYKKGEYKSIRDLLK